MINFFQSSSAWLPLLDVGIRATVLLAAAALVAAMLRRASAASRHLIWTCALLAALALPLLSLALPRWQLPLVTFRAAAPAAAPVHNGDDAGAIPQAPPPSLSAVSDDRKTTGSPAVTQTPTLANLPWTALLAVVWAAGALVILGRLAAGVIAVHLMSRRTTPATGAPWLPLARHLASELGVARVTFRRSAQSSMPMTWGFARPSVVLPAAADAWPAERLRIALVHELAHVKRADCLTHMLAQAACAVYWMNPLAWLAARRARAERERACDDLVLACGTPGADYADELLQIARVARSDMFSATAASASLAMARRSQFEGRLMAILDPSVPRAGLSRVRTLSATAVAVLTLVPLASVQPWTHAEAAVVPPIPAEQRAGLAAPSPPRGPAIPPKTQAPQTANITGQPDLATVTAGVLEGVAGAIGHAVAGSTTDAMTAAVDAVLSQNPNPNPNPDPDVRRSSKADPKVVAALTEALKDTDKEVRESAMHALVRLRDPGIYEPLVQALKDESADVRESAVQRLGQLRDKRAVTPLLSMLKDASAGVREQVVFALGQLRDSAAVDGLIAALRDESASVREQAAFALGQIRDLRAVEPLAAAIKDTSADVREQAVFALGQLRARSTVDPLIAALRDETDDVREQAAFALGQIRDARATDALSAALKDASADVRRQAAFALGQLAR